MQGKPAGVRPGRCRRARGDRIRGAGRRSRRRSYSIIVALYRIARPHDAVLGDYPDADGWVDVGAYPEAVTEPGLLVYRFDAPVLRQRRPPPDRVEQALSDNPGEEEWLVLDFEGVGALDATALDVLVELAGRVADLGLRVVGSPWRTTGF